MATDVRAIQEELAAILNTLAGVFSTPQWGGRAYKVPRPSAAGKARMLAFMAITGDADAVQVSFKIPLPDAEAAVEQHDWIAPHSFRTLAPAGWLTATVSTKRHVRALGTLLRRSHAMYRVDTGDTGETRCPTPSASGGMGHIDRIMDKARSEGWTPRSDW